VTGGAASIVPGMLPWAVADVDHEHVLAEVGRRFPGVTAYFGEFTGSWWALVGNRLLEARTPREFVEVIGTAVASSLVPGSLSPTAVYGRRGSPRLGVGPAGSATPKRPERLAVASFSPKHARRHRWQAALRRFFRGEGSSKATPGVVELEGLGRP
jgi:hypothetical protein